ncbi:MerR family transcriptional regulator [Lapidilactobacillus salsurivasis]
MGYKISDVSRITGLSAYTLRYYDKKGLLPFVDRDSNGRRHFKEHDFEFLAVITCLKETGMQLDEIRQFVDWCLIGDTTLTARLDFFIAHREKVEAQLAQVQGYLQKVDHKIDYYQRACAAGTEDAVRETATLPQPR